MASTTLAALCLFLITIIISSYTATCYTTSRLNQSMSAVGSGERFNFYITNEQKNRFGVSASSEDDRHWEIPSIDENSARLFTNGDYPLPALKTIIEKILIRRINDPDISANFSLVKEDLLVIITVKEKWVERNITLQFDSNKNVSDVIRLESALAKTRRELEELKQDYNNVTALLKAVTSPLGSWTVLPNDTYTLSSSNSWETFPGLFIQLSLQHSALVDISYSITTESASGSNTHLCTKLVIDGTNKPETRRITGNTLYHSNEASLKVQLGAGEHTVRVDYRTPGRFVNCAISDWNSYALSVVELKRFY
jgi:hypothetical protein